MDYGEYMKHDPSFSYGFKDPELARRFASVSARGPRPKAVLVWQEDESGALRAVWRAPAEVDPPDAICDLAAQSARSRAAARAIKKGKADKKRGRA